ncbi:methyl-accepting chemotaxis protein [Candidatus Vondammii sp. HM_W22]|uniref:methyl-accepting chemotaxis protein n=1 Tax=Candidatus Vondammii sp. HM_W22 TaxID=2687299 RepID=UPI00240278C6|nr:methyl-accepting chemotaxis protein [Candidatus Vondammii sp. HM_W22]
MNASIEAAGADEHGWGFSVVADEVRALSKEKTKIAARVIHGTLGRFRKQVEMITERVGSYMWLVRDDQYRSWCFSVNNLVNLSNPQTARSVSYTMQRIALLLCL